MKHSRMTHEQIEAYRNFLQTEEKSELTVDKYIRDVKKLMEFTRGAPLTKELCTAYKTYLMETGYAPRSVNSMLAAVNSFLTYLGLSDCRVKQLRIQKQTYCDSDAMLTRREYQKLVEAARGRQLCLIMQTMAGTGIRVSELSAFTVEGLQQGSIRVSCKGKNRVILVPSRLRRQLLDYARRHHIQSGPVFTDSKGQPVSRSTVWRQMKRLCKVTGIAASKVFPHNLRKLFARTFYKLEKDIAKLADILGHYSIETTRIYIMESGDDHRRRLERLKLII